MWIQTSRLLAILGAALLLGASLVAPVMAADDRTAGTVHHDDSANRQAAHSSEPVLDVNYTRLESEGLLTKPKDGSLGRDLWNGSKRSLILDYLPQLPGISQYRTIQSLSKRLLLTQVDAGLIDQDVKPEPGNDLTTLRLEKLLEMGAYDEAIALYTNYRGEPYHERFAHAGVLAALYARQPALACLETKALGDRFADVAFWQQLTKICSYILSKSGNAKDKPLSSDLEFPESKILQQIVKKESFRFSPRTVEDLQELAPLEAAVLAADNRFDLSGFRFEPGEDLPPHVLALFMKDPSLSSEQAFLLMLEAVKTGLKSSQELAGYYDKKAVELFGKNRKKTSLMDYQTIAGWKRLPYLYRAATNASAGREQSAIIRKALELVPEYGTVALWPLADMIALMDPEDLDSPSIRRGFVVLAETGEPISPEWANIWRVDQGKESDMSKPELLTFVAYSIGNGHNDKSEDQVPEIKGDLKNLNEQELQLLEVIYEKLDKQLKLHNYGASNVYEKPQGLTSAVDYVMPSVGLLDDLKNAQSEQRLGEIILLSSIALRDASPEKLYAGTFREVIDGLVTVGLTKEAQSLAREVMLGLSVK